MPLPTPSEPVNEIARTSGCATSGVPTLEPDPVTRLRTPLGMPACSRILTSSSEVSGACDAGLNTTALPETSAGAIFHVGMAMGKFHGAIRATTPSGCLMVYMNTRGRSDGIVWPERRAPSPPKYSRMRTARVTSPLASPIVLPSSRLSRSPISAIRLSRIAAALSRILPRAGAGMDAQPGNAFCAAWTAASTSAASESWSSPTTSRVSAGLMFSKVRPVRDARHSPSMKLR